MKGKTCVLTGATSGLGRATAEALGRKGANLFLVGRNEKRGMILAKGLRGLHRAHVEFIQADLSANEEVRALAARINSNGACINVLINNAGGRFDRFQESVDGVEMTFATNHLGHFLLTLSLLRKLDCPEGGRVITVTSSAHRSARLEGISWSASPAAYDRKQAYARSKLANVLFAFELARRLRCTRIVSNAVDPGGVATNFAGNNGLQAWAKHMLSHWVRGDLVSASTAAETIVWLATEPKLASLTGRLFRQRREIEASPDARNARLGAELWNESIKLTNTQSTLCP